MLTALFAITDLMLYLTLVRTIRLSVYRILTTRREPGQCIVRTHFLPRVFTELMYDAVGRHLIFNLPLAKLCGSSLLN